MDDETTGRPPDEIAAQPSGGGESAAGSADTAETSVAPPADADATRVMSGEAVDETRVMPAAGGAAPPPARPQPTLMMSRPPKQSSNTWWIVLIVVLLVLAAAAAAWYFVLRDKGEAPAPQPSPTPTFAWVGAWGRTDGTGGGVVVEPKGKDYQVTVYGSTLQVLGSAVATPKGKDLTFALESSETADGLPGPFQITLRAGPGENLAEMKVTGSNQATVIVPLQRVAVLVPATPSAAPTVAPTSSPTSSPTLSPSSSPSASPTAGADQQVIDAIVKLQTGVITWSTNNNSLYPAPVDVSEAGGIASYVDPWPTNPYTGQPMKPGTQPGDYTYEQLSGGAGYKLTGYISNGLTYTVP